MRVKFTIQQRYLSLAIGAITIMLAGVFLTASAFAQSGDKMAYGKVEDNGEQPLSSAIVYLKDTHTLDVKSYITEPDGVYRFGQISSNDDYKLWAELNGKKSAVKTISSYDDKRKLLINLHIDTAK